MYLSHTSFVIFLNIFLFSTCTSALLSARFPTRTDVHLKRFWAHEILQKIYNKKKKKIKKKKNVYEKLSFMKAWNHAIYNYY